METNTEKSWWNQLTKLSQYLIIGVGIAAVLGVVGYISPGISVAIAKQVKGLVIDTNDINNVTKGAKLSLPSESVSTEIANKGLIRIAEYAWNGNAGMIAANGGPRTTEGSLMEDAGINLEIVRLDGVNDLRNMMIKFVEEFDKGVAYPKSDKSAFAVSVMGDGAPFLVTTTQKALDEKFGKGKYHVQILGAYGLSYGEDKIIGPKICKDNPQSMKGSVISSVIGDGDWVVA